MLRSRFIPFAFRLATIALFAVRLATGASLPGDAAHPSSTEDAKATAAAADVVIYKWNVDEKEAPLLGFAEDRIKAGLDRTLAYRLDRFKFPIFQPLVFDEERGHYVLPSLASAQSATHFIEFAPTDIKHQYATTDGSNIHLIDNDTMKTIRTADGTRYFFVRYPDGEFRCATIKEANGATLNMLYSANGLMLHGLVDASGRSVTFSYDRSGISAVTQTWMTHAEGNTKTWSTVESPNTESPKAKYSHVIALKLLPTNALVREYTAEMAASDDLLAHIFGGPNAVAGAHGFEPAGLAATYPLYRGDVMGDDGVARRGHLSYAMHLYGSADGTGDSPLYVPAGFTQHSDQPSPTDAAVTFYYPKLGNFSDVTLAVFHVADFQIQPEGNRVRIGNLGGPGGSSPQYKHSHIEVYRGNTGLPPLASRALLRIDLTRMFAPATTEK